MLSPEIEEKIVSARRVDIHYSTPHETKYAVVRYTCQQGKPLKVASYYIYGEELKSGKPLICWHWLPSTNFCIVEDGFDSEEAAAIRLKELKSELNNKEKAHE